MSCFSRLSINDVQFMYWKTLFDSEENKQGRYEEQFSILKNNLIVPCVHNEGLDRGKNYLVRFLKGIQFELVIC